MTYHDLENNIQSLLNQKISPSDFHKTVFKQGGLIENAIEQAKLIDSLEDRKVELRKITEIRNNYFEIYRQMLSKSSPYLDTTLSTVEEFGLVHPITFEIERIRNIMFSYGFTEIEGPKMEVEKHNFDSLNVDKMHPARDAHDTFYLDNGLLLRTHTSNVQVRHLEKGPQEPFAIFSIGKVYRRDSDKTHSPVFHQMELMVVDDQRANLATLKGLIRSFICDFFGRKNVKMRFRPNYFPFTEPSMEVDIYYHGADSEGWLEVLGSGIVRKNILERCGYKSNGIALGIGIERLCMLKNGITNILDLYKNKYYFLKNFSQKSL